MMDKRFLESVLLRQREKLEKKRELRFFRRTDENRVDLFSTQAQVVTGVRGCGKTTMCCDILFSNGVPFAYVNFGDADLKGVGAEDLNNILEVLYKIHGRFEFLLMDEPANVPGWYLFANRLLRRGMHLFVTASDTDVMAGEGATHMTGRYHPVTLYPLSFSEYCALERVDTWTGSTLAVAFRRAAFDRYMSRGGFPGLLGASGGSGDAGALADEILSGVAAKRFGIFRKEAFGEMARHLLKACPAVTADNELARRFALGSDHTAKRYAACLQRIGLLNGLSKFSGKIRHRRTGGKLYPVDTAFMDGDAEKRLETIVFTELLRRCARRKLGISYYKDRSGGCDFIVCRGGRAALCVQAAYDLSNPKTLRREISGLLNAAKATNCGNLLLVTDHMYDDMEKKGLGIAVRPAYEWLLQDWQDAAES